MLKKYVTQQLKKINFNSMQFSSSRSLRNDLCGRDIIQPMDLTLNDWKKILWSAMDLKQEMRRKNGCLNVLLDKHATLLFTKPCGRNLLSCSRGAQLLGAKTTLYLDLNFEAQENFIDTGRALSPLTDAIIVNGCNQAVLLKLAEGSSAPVIGLTTNMFCIIKAMAFLMTIQEYFGYLKRIKLAWIGPSTPLCNCILATYPLFGIHLKLCSICALGSGQTTPIALEHALLSCNKGSGEIHQCTSAAEAVYRSHVIIVSSHTEIENRVTIELVEEAELDWIFLHPLPRTDIEVSEGVFQHKNNLTWITSVNHLYIAMALMAATITSYEPRTSIPSFEGPC